MSSSQNSRLYFRINTRQSVLLSASSLRSASQAKLRSITTNQIANVWSILPPIKLNMPSNYIHDRYLDSEERYEVRVVKAAERPNLLHWEEDGMNGSSADEKKTDESFQPPLTDGCDLPGWRAKRLAPCMSVEENHIDGNDLVLGGSLNIGTGSTLFRRESQFPFIAHDRAESCWWYRTKKKLCVPPPADRNAPVVEYDEMCVLVDYVKSDGCTEERRKATYFSLEFEEKNRPVKILGATLNWPAMPNYDETKHTEGKESNEGWADISDHSDSMTAKGKGGWTYANLVSRFGNISWRFSDQHGEMMSLNTYTKYITTPEGRSDDSPLGIYDSQFGDDDPTKILLNEYTVPKCFSQDLFELERCDSDGDETIEKLPAPPFRWVLIGPERSGTGLHVDPLWTNAWVTVIQGRKRWLLFPPETPYESIGMIEGRPQIPSSIWFADYYDKVTSASWPNDYKPVEILQCHGETVFVPAG